MKRKFVCLCQGGNSRSVALAYLLKYHYGVDALACGWEKNSPETLIMLFEWAEVICILQDEFKRFIPEKFHTKIEVFDVGPDIWFNSLHPQLLNKLQGMIADKTQEGKRNEVSEGSKN